MNVSMTSSSSLQHVITMSLVTAISADLKIKSWLARRKNRRSCRSRLRFDQHPCGIESRRLQDPGYTHLLYTEYVLPLEYTSPGEPIHWRFGECPSPRLRCPSLGNRRLRLPD